MTRAVICPDLVPLKKKWSKPRKDGKSNDLWNAKRDRMLRQMTADALCPAVMQLILKIPGRNPEKMILDRRHSLGIDPPPPI